VTLGLEPTEQTIQRYIYNRLQATPQFRTLIAVSVERYASEFAATVWVTRTPDKNMRVEVNKLGDEVRLMFSVPCSIVIKTDRDLPFGGRQPLRTQKGDFIYRYYKIDPAKDEDFVVVYAVYHGITTYRFRMSLTGTLSSMLRSRGLFNENRILAFYVNQIRERIETTDLPPEQVHELMFSSKDLAKFQLKAAE